MNAPPMKAAAFVRPWLIFALVAGAIELAYFWPAVTEGRVMVAADILFGVPPWNARPPDGFVTSKNGLLGDVPMLVYPYLSFAVDAVRRGEFPLWDAGTYAGHPFFAAGQSAVLSPFTAIAYLAGLPHATTLMAAAKIAVGGAGMFALAGSLGIGWQAALVAGVAFLLNPFAMVWLEHPLSGVVAWLPWLLWATERQSQAPSFGRASLTALVVAACIFGGHPETAFKVLLVGAAYAAVRSLSRPRPIRSLAVGVASYAAGLLLAMVQVLPFVEYLTQSPAWTARQDFPLNPYVAPARTAITALVPDFFGNPSTASYALTNYNYCEQQAYAGMAVWILAAVGMVTARRDPRARFFAFVLALSLALKYGLPGVLHVASALPLLHSTSLSRFGLIAVTAAIVLAGYGVKAALIPGGRSAAVAATTAAVCAVAAIAVAYGAEVPFLETAGLVARTRLYATL
ncbi:MAG: hypothetical protein EHM13_06490, partial [Acidobacteria bacterium]